MCCPNWWLFVKRSPRNEWVYDMVLLIWITISCIYSLVLFCWPVKPWERLFNFSTPWVFILCMVGELFHRNIGNDILGNGYKPENMGNSTTFNLRAEQVCFIAWVQVHDGIYFSSIFYFPFICASVK